MRWAVFAVIAFAFSCKAGWATTYTAASCNESDVQAAITAEQAHHVDGDIISIPSGNCTWTSGISATFINSVTIQGAGAMSATAGGSSTTGSDLTVIINNNGSDPIMRITTTTGKSFRFTGIAVLENASSGSKNDANLVIGGQSSAVRVDHCHFYIFVGGSKGLGFVDGVTGVADHLYINTTQGVTNNILFNNGGSWQGDADPNKVGNQSWVDTDHFGTRQYMYVEDTLMSGGWVGDCGVGGRYVIRYSTVLNNYGAANHGTHDQYRGCRAAEFYKNTFTLTTDQMNGGITHNNSGTTLLWGNTINGLSGSPAIGYYYAIDMSLSRISGNYGTVPYPPAGFGMCGNVLQSNGLSEDSPWDGNQDTTTGWPCMDQNARGAGDLLSGYPMSNTVNVTAGSTRTWPHQALVPIYVWANTLTGTPLGIVNDNTGILVDNRDYYQQFGTFGEPGSFNGTKGVGQGLLSARPSTCTAGPGGNTPGVGYWATDTNTLYVCNPTNTWTVYYAPYTYPHPLTQSSGTPPAAPTKLNATVN